MKKSTSYFTLGLLCLLVSGSAICLSQSRAESDTSVTPKAVPGPDIIVGDIGAFGGLVQLGSVGGQVGLAMGTTSCNNGSVNLDFVQLPNANHPVVTQNFYRMSGGPNNNDRFEQIGQG